MLIHCNKIFSMNEINRKLRKIEEQINKVQDCLNNINRSIQIIIQVVIQGKKVAYKFGEKQN